MIKITFVCHGNICRSPMAEYIFKNLLKQKNLSEKFEVTSFATSNEAIGEDIYTLAQNQLALHSIPFQSHKATRINTAAYKANDYVVCMEEYNVINLKRYLFLKNSDKISLLLDYTDNPRDLSDPWYTQDFETAYEDIEVGCKAFLSYLINKYNL